jgi:putative ABC transport system permease protein
LQNCGFEKLRVPKDDLGNEINRLPFFLAIPNINKQIRLRISSGRKIKLFFKNLKYFLRSFRKDKTFVIINLFGMTAGILIALLAGFYAFYQLSYDRFVKNHDRIYRIEYIANRNGKVTYSSQCSSSLAKVLQAEAPGIKDIMFILKPGIYLQLDCEGNLIDLDNWCWATKNFIDYHGIQFIRGTKESGLVDGKSLLITESFANKYFPNQNPLGKELRFKQYNVTRFFITGVIKDLPPNSHIQVDAITLDSSQWPDGDKAISYDPENIISYEKHVYLILEEHTSIEQVLEQFSLIKEKYLASLLEEKGYDLELTATKITDTHFHQGLFNDLPTENINSIYYFLLIAMVVILISIINFINLSLARHTSRKLDIGIRKTIGATKTQIFGQYLLESYLFILISFVLALIAFYLLLPTFAEFNGLELMGTRFSVSGFNFLIPILLIVGFLAGFYPALVTARKNPQFILQYKNASRSKKSNRIFIIIQLILSSIFFIGTSVIFLQLKFSNDKDKGYNLENVIVYEYPNWGPNAAKTEDICEMLIQSAYINDVAVATKLPGQDIFLQPFNVELPEQNAKVETELMYIDDNFLPFTGINLLYGRNFDKNLASDSAKVIVNTTFAKTYGKVENAIGSRVYFPTINDDDEAKLDAEIIGVISDFHFQSMHNKITPLVLSSSRWAPNFFYIKYDPRNLKFVQEDAKKVFDQLAEKYIFAGKKHFPEEELLKQYEADKHLSQMTIWLAILSIILAILGVFGLTAFLVRNNLKMLCVRKVFGAETKDLFKLLLKDYSIVLLVSNLIALPLAWYVCTKWLERFAYHISLSIWLFAAGIFMSVIIVIIAILYHVWIISKTDPVVYLQDE